MRTQFNRYRVVVTRPTGEVQRIRYREAYEDIITIYNALLKKHRGRNCVYLEETDGVINPGHRGPLYIAIKWELP